MRRGALHAFGKAVEGDCALCGGRGCYANSIERNMGLAPQLGYAGEHGCHYSSPSSNLWRWVTGISL